MLGGSAKSFSSVEVAGAADVFVQQRRTVRGLRWRRLVEPVFEDRSDTGVSQNADFDGATADRLRPRRVKAAEQPQHPKTGAKPLFRMRPARQPARISASVSGPMSRAWRANFGRPFAHSAGAHWVCDRAKYRAADRRSAGRGSPPLPRWKISTVRAVARVSTCSRISACGTE